MSQSAENDAGVRNTERPGYDFRGRQIAPATRADWWHDARPTNYDSARVAVLNRRIIELLDALDEAEERVARLLCERHQAASPTRRPCAACVQTATECATCSGWAGWMDEPCRECGGRGVVDHLGTPCPTCVIPPA